MERNLRKERIGVVVSNKMDKTIVVAVETKGKHPMYGKFINMTRMSAARVIPCASWKHVLSVRQRGGD